METIQTPLWKVIFSKNYQSTIQHYDLYVIAIDTNEAIKIANKWYIEHWFEGEREPKEPYIWGVQIASPFVVIA